MTARDITLLKRMALLSIIVLALAFALSLSSCRSTKNIAKEEVADIHIQSATLENQNDSSNIARRLSMQFDSVEIWLEPAIIDSITLPPMSKIVRLKAKKASVTQEENISSSHYVDKCSTSNITEHLDKNIKEKRASGPPYMLIIISLFSLIIVSLVFTSLFRH